MFNKVFVEKGGMLGLIPECYKYERMCEKSVDNYSHAFRLVSYCYKIEKSVQ